MVALLATGCGSRSAKPSVTAPRGSLAALTSRSPTVALTPGDADFAPGPIRYSFLVIAKNGRPIDRPTARVYLAYGLNAKPFEHATAKREPIGIPGVSKPPFGVHALYVVHLRVPRAGRYWIAALPAQAKITGLANIDVRTKTFSPAIGAMAPRSKTPTLASTHGKLSGLTTAQHQSRALYRTSVAQALAAHEPFVLVFATPKFCESRTCGPVVDVVSLVQQQLGRTAVRFIHVEVYKDNDPAKGYNRWMKEWTLQSEPWIFLVGRDGRLKAKFEGSVSAAELQRAIVATHLR